MEIYWPLDWLPEGITLVDSPGIGEDSDLSSTVNDAMESAFGIVYVVNTPNAGGMSSDRVSIIKFGVHV